MSKPQKHALKQLRQSAQDLLDLTADCQSMEEAALKLYIQVNAQSNAPDRHSAMCYALRNLGDKIGHGMMIFMELYEKGSAQEQRLDTQ